MIIFAILTSAAVASATPQCTAGGNEVAGVLAVTRETPKPLGLVLGMGSDMGPARYLVVRTTHYLGAPGLPRREGKENTTYYVTGYGKTCFKELDPVSCPRLIPAVRIYRSRSYNVMHDNGRLRPGTSTHSPFALLRAQDGYGSVVNISTTEPGHALLHDAAQTFSSIASCTKDVDGLMPGP